VLVDGVSSEDLEKSLFHNSIEKMRDPSHVRIYSLSEIEEMFNLAGTDITDITHWEIPQDFEEWMTRAGSDKRQTEMVERLMQESMEGDSTGLWVKLENGRLGFTYDTIILIAQVRR
jgi:hypothetical protein